MPSDKDAIIVMFSKEQVRQRKLAHFLKTFGPAALPEGPALATMMGNFQFLVDGWNDDPNELYAIPENARCRSITPNTSLRFKELWRDAVTGLRIQIRVGKQRN